MRDVSKICCATLAEAEESDALGNARFAAEKNSAAASPITYRVMIRTTSVTRPGRKIGREFSADIAIARAAVIFDDDEGYYHP